MTETTLDKQLHSWLDKVPSSIDNVDLPIANLKAIIAPHAGYSYSGPAAAWAYKCLDKSRIKRIFILGPSHHVYLDGCALTKCDQYETPLGNLIIDKETVAELRQTGKFSDMSISTDEDEHSIEMHLPYTFAVAPEAKIVPILVGSISTRKEKEFGKLLAPYLSDPETIFIVSSDFCHWGRRFSYTYYEENGKVTHLSGNTSAPIHESISRLDHEGMDIIESGSATEFASYLSKTKNTICGRHPIGVLLNALEGQNIEIKFTRYEQSSQVMSANDSSVSYASAYVVGK